MSHFILQFYVLIRLFLITPRFATKDFQNWKAPRGQFGPKTAVISKRSPLMSVNASRFKKRNR